MSTLAQSPGNAAVRPGTNRLATLDPAPRSMEVPMQAGRSKPAPLASPGFGDGEGRGGANVHTALATSSPKVWEITTEEAVERLRNKKKAKYLIQISHSLLKLGRFKEDKSLWCCGNYFNPYEFPCGTEKLIPYRCNSPLCLECARRRAKYYERRIWDIIKEDKTNYFMLTLTMKSVFMLTRETINKLIGSLARLREEKVWNEYVDGGFYAAEVTHNSRAGWHPHLHCLIKTKCRLPESFLTEIKESWKRITGDSDYIHIQRVYGIDKNGKPTRRINRRAIKELVKYTTKSMDFCAEPDLVGQFLDSFKHVRRLQGFGCFFNVSAKVEKDVDPSTDRSALVGCKCGTCHWYNGRRRAPLHRTCAFRDIDGEWHTLPEFARGSPNEELERGSMSEGEYVEREKERLSALQTVLFI